MLDLIFVSLLLGKIKCHECQITITITVWSCAHLWKAGKMTCIVFHAKMYCIPCQHYMLCWMRFDQPHLGLSFTSSCNDIRSASAGPSSHVYSSVWPTMATNPARESVL